MDPVSPHMVGLRFARRPRLRHQSDPTRVGGYGARPRRPLAAASTTGVMLNSHSGHRERSTPTLTRAPSRAATVAGLSKDTRKPVDTCADYLLAAGYPIATGVIEGACRYLVRDRMELTGARWRLVGAEAVLKLRALRASGDFDAYWDFHEAREYERNHAQRYTDGTVPPVTEPPPPLSSPRLSTGQVTLAMPLAEPRTRLPSAASATSGQRRALTSLRRILAMKRSPAVTASKWPRSRATSSDSDALGRGDAIGGRWRARRSDPPLRTAAPGPRPQSPAPGQIVELGEVGAEGRVLEPPAVEPSVEVAERPTVTPGGCFGASEASANRRRSGSGSADRPGGPPNPRLVGGAGGQPRRPPPAGATVPTRSPPRLKRGRSAPGLQM